MPTDLDDKPDNPQLAPYRDLRERSRGEFFVVEGELAVRRLLESKAGWDLHSLVGTPTRLARLAGLVDSRCPVLEANHAQLRELTGFDFHRGVLASARRRRAWGVAAESLARWRDADEFLAVVAHRIADPSNLGAMARNARALGAHLLCVDAGGADPLSAKAVRASAGQIFELPTLAYENLDELHQALDAAGCRLWAACLGAGSQSLVESAPARPTHLALCIGNEGEGLDEAFLARCDKRVHIAMTPGVDSLNAAAASAVFLYALRGVAPRTD
jgi:tRNA G18 (ribose-2'-O)-methylase SpoU